MGEDMDSSYRLPVWIDCDPGHDDACALLLAAYHQSLDLIGVSIVHGNAPLSKCTFNALSVLEAIGKPEIPVFPGLSRPFCRTVHTAPDIHGASGLGGTDLLPQPTRSALTHCSAILEMRSALLSQPKGTPYIVASGPLTNVALLFTLFPEVAEHIAGLSVMGGAIGSDFTHVSVRTLFFSSCCYQRVKFLHALHYLRPVKPGLFDPAASLKTTLTPGPALKMGQAYLDTQGTTHARIGNRTPFAEFNIWADPESAHSVFQNPLLKSKTTLITLDVTHQAYATHEIQRMLLNGINGPTRIRRMFNELLMFFEHTYTKVFGLSEGPPLHDPLAVAVLLEYHPDPRVRINFDDNGGERWDVNVILEGEQTGRTVITKSLNNEGVRVPRGLETSKFWHTLEECMARADEATGYMK